MSAPICPECGREIRFAPIGVNWRHEYDPEHTTYILYLRCSDEKCPYAYEIMLEDEHWGGVMKEKYGASKVYGDRQRRITTREEPEMASPLNRYERQNG